MNFTRRHALGLVAGVAFSLIAGNALAAVYAVRPGDGSVLRQTLPDPAAEVTDVGWDADSQSIRLATGSEDAWRWDLVANRVTRATP